MNPSLIVGLALLVGAAVGWLLRHYVSKRLEAITRTAFEEKLAAARREGEVLLSERQAALEQRLKDRDRALAEQRDLLEEAERKLCDAFSATASRALSEASDQFLNLASQSLAQAGEKSHGELKALMEPLNQSLTRLDSASREIETKRAGAYESLGTKINSLVRETEILSRALRRPQIRGAWGELSLQNIAEGAGLIQGQDFVTQSPIEGEEGSQRPDMIVMLPHGREIAVDAKTPLDALRESFEAVEESVRVSRLRDHAKAVREHVRLLAGKKYWSSVDRSPEMVVLYLPDSAYCAAVEVDPSLLEYAMRHRIILANPLSVIAILRAVAHVLDQERLAKNAEEVQAVGRELYTRLLKFVENQARVGRALSSTVSAYNTSVGSLETTVLRKARQLKDYGAGLAQEIPTVQPLEVVTRPSIGNGNATEGLLSACGDVGSSTERHG